MTTLEERKEWLRSELAKIVAAEIDDQVFVDDIYCLVRYTDAKTNQRHQALVTTMDRDPMLILGVLRAEEIKWEQLIENMYMRQMFRMEEDDD